MAPPELPIEIEAVPSADESTSCDFEELERYTLDELVNARKGITRRKVLLAGFAGLLAFNAPGLLNWAKSDVMELDTSSDSLREESQRLLSRHGISDSDKVVFVAQDGDNFHDNFETIVRMAMTMSALRGEHATTDIIVSISEDYLKDLSESQLDSLSFEEKLALCPFKDESS